MSFFFSQIQNQISLVLDVSGVGYEGVFWKVSDAKPATTQTQTENIAIPWQSQKVGLSSENLDPIGRDPELCALTLLQVLARSGGALPALGARWAQGISPCAPGKFAGVQSRESERVTAQRTVCACHLSPQLSQMTPASMAEERSQRSRGRAGVAGAAAEPRISAGMMRAARNRGAGPCPRAGARGGGAGDNARGRAQVRGGAAGGVRSAAVRGGAGRAPAAPPSPLSRQPRPEPRTARRRCRTRVSPSLCPSVPAERLRPLPAAALPGAERRCRGMRALRGAAPGGSRRPPIVCGAPSLGARCGRGGPGLRWGGWRLCRGRSAGVFASPEPGGCRRGTCVCPPGAAGAAVPVNSSRVLLLSSFAPRWSPRPFYSLSEERFIYFKWCYLFSVVLKQKRPFCYRSLCAAFMNSLCHHKTCASRVISEMYEVNEYSLTGTRRAQAPASIFSSYKSVSWSLCLPRPQRCISLAVQGSNGSEYLV